MIITKLTNAYRSTIFIQCYNESFGIFQQFNEEVWCEKVVMFNNIFDAVITLIILYIQSFKECIQQVIHVYQLI